MFDRTLSARLRAFRLEPKPPHPRKPLRHPRPFRLSASRRLLPRPTRKAQAASGCARAVLPPARSPGFPPASGGTSSARSRKPVPALAPAGRSARHLACRPPPRRTPATTAPPPRALPARPQKRLALRASLVVLALDADSRRRREMPRSGPCSPRHSPVLAHLGDALGSPPRRNRSLISAPRKSARVGDGRNPAAGNARASPSASAPCHGPCPPRPGPLGRAPGRLDTARALPAPLDAAPPWTGEDGQPAGGGCGPRAERPPARWAARGRPDPAGAGCGPFGLRWTLRPRTGGNPRCAGGAAPPSGGIRRGTSLPP